MYKIIGICSNLPAQEAWGNFASSRHLAVVSQVTEAPAQLQVVTLITGSSGGLSQLREISRAHGKSKGSEGVEAKGILPERNQRVMRQTPGERNPRQTGRKPVKSLKARGLRAWEPK